MVVKKSVDIGELIKSREKASKEKNIKIWAENHPDGGVEEVKKEAKVEEEKEVTKEEEPAKEEVKEEPQVEAEEPSQTKPKLLDRHVSLHIKPRTMLKLGAFFVIFLVVFMGGRVSSSFIASDAGMTGYLTGLIGGIDEVVKATESVVEEPKVEEKPVEIPKEEPNEEVVEEPKEEVEQKVITTYVNTDFTLNDVQVEWHETWGKIVRLDYSITNGESGIIKAKSIGIQVEGYGDFEKVMTLPLSAQEIKMGKTYEAITNFPAGFAYSEATTGDLGSVNIIATLYNVDNEVIDRHIGDYNLKG